MSYMRSTYKSRCFDFEIGHLKKSPCKTCYHHFRFPACLETCSILDRIQTLLARTVSTSCNHSPAEDFAVRIEE